MRPAVDVAAREVLMAEAAGARRSLEALAEADHDPLVAGLRERVRKARLGLAEAEHELRAAEAQHTQARASAEAIVRRAERALSATAPRELDDFERELTREHGRILSGANIRGPEGAPRAAERAARILRALRELPCLRLTCVTAADARVRIGELQERIG